MAMYTHDSSFEDGFVIIPKDNFNLMYIVAILNSFSGSLHLSEQNLKKRKAVTMKTLGALPIRIVSSIEQNSIAYLYYLVLCVTDMVRNDGEDRNLQFRKEFYQEVLDDITLELLMPDVFEEKNISILSEWIEVIGTCCNEDKNVTMEQLQDDIGNYILQPGNKLTNSVKLFRFIKDEIERQLEKHEMEN